MSNSIQYILNDEDERVAVIIPIAEFESMLAEMGLTLDEFEQAPSRPLKPILDQLRTAGKIDI